MDSYNKDNLNLVKLAESKDLGALISSKSLEKIVTKVYLSMQSQVEQIVANDEEEDMKKQSLAEVQETAGFEEPQGRAALGGLFNMVFFLSTLDSKAGVKEPQGTLGEAICKHFTDYASFKEAFKKTVQSRF